MCRVMMRYPDPHQQKLYGVEMPTRVGQCQGANKPRTQAAWWTFLHVVHIYTHGVRDLD